MNNFSLIILLSLSAFACSGKKNSSASTKDSQKASNPMEMHLHETLSWSLLFRESDEVININGVKGKARGNHDYNAYLPDNGSSEKGMLYVGHETNDTSSVLGDGGGGTVFQVKKINGKWESSKDKYSIDFSPVGGTYQNCSGYLTAKGTILTAEEFPPGNNRELYKEGRGTRDTSDFNNLKAWQNMGWMVEVDPVNKKAIRKLYKMGRFSHEAAWVMPDRKTVYLTDDFSPSVFFKFIAKKEDDFEEGQLFAFKQDSLSGSGSWIKLPMDMNSLVNIRNVALTMGASMFVRMEWMTLLGDKLYITETGQDNFDWTNAVAQGGIPAPHLKDFNTEGAKYDYPFGSVLVFDTAKDHMKILIKGGKGEKSDKHFSNPDGITHCTINGINYLVINEDLIHYTNGRVPDHILPLHSVQNEIWWLDLSIDSPKVDDLERMMVAPLGAETTGGYFTPDQETYFVNIQHPRGDNVYPFDKSSTIAITGIKEFTSGFQKR